MLPAFLFTKSFLEGDKDAHRTYLEIMRKPDMIDSEKSMTRTGYIHLAFGLGSKEAVDLLTGRLKEDGYEVISGPRMTGGGYYESCIVGIEGNLIEITA